MRSIFSQHGIPKVVFSDNGPNIVHMSLRNFSNHGISYTRPPVPSFLRVMDLWRELFKPLTKPYKNAERMIVTLIRHVSATHNDKQLWHIRLRVTDEKKVANTYLR